MHLTFLGAVRTVTGSCFLLSVGQRNVMVDCGLYQGLPDLEERNYTHPAVDWSRIDAILLTHAHIDHAGLIPRAVNAGFRGKVFCHPATLDLAEVMLLDAADQQMHEAEWLSRKRVRAGKSEVQPLFSRSDVSRAMRRFERVEYEEPVEIVPGVVAEFRDSGHLLGSASIAVGLSENGIERRVVFSGDIGHHQAPILREPLGFEEADVVLLESTYGDRTHDVPPRSKEILKEIVRDAVRKKSKVVIPSFAVGRTQELLYFLGELLRDGEIPRVPLYLDSPMAIAATEIHERHPECFDPETLARIRAGENPFRPDGLIMSRTVNQSRAINKRSGPAVVIAGGGMCEGGRVVHHLKHSLYDPDNHLVFAGYQAEGTLGRFILDGAKKVKLFGDEVVVRARVTMIEELSAHADQNGLLDWLRFFRKAPQMLFIVHGEEKAGLALSEAVRVHLGFSCYLPKLGQVVDLRDPAAVMLGKRAFAPRRMPTTADVREILARVGAHGEEFRSVVRGYLVQLAQRINEARSHGRDPGWRETEAEAVLKHILEVLEKDLGVVQDLVNKES